MNVFGVGPLELAVILIVALVFVGPDRLPRLAADLARTLREIRKYTSGLAAEFNEVIKDVEKETEGERGVWKEVAEGIGGATQQVTQAMRGVRQDIFKQDAAGSANGAAPANGAADTWVEIPDPDAAQETPAAAEPAAQTPAAAEPAPNTTTAAEPTAERAETAS
jgi:sec-independent protein translocase protein TatB